jgi:2-polyprenyl-6-hydroxyphenyl methylase/3-demethylubiquinone-9 3-methyltransferase
VRPSELARLLRGQGFTVTDLCGMTYDPLRRRFTLSPQDLSVNYLVSATR